jgi:hypothetical protein
MGAKYITMFVNLNIVSSALRLGEQRQRDPEEDAEDDDLEHLPLGDRLGDVLGEYVEDDVRCGLLDGGDPRRLQRLRLNHTHAGAGDVDGREPDEEGESGHDLEIEERLDSETPDLAEVRVPGNSDHQRSEEEGGDDGLDELEKNLRQDAGALAHRGPVVPDLRADGHGDEDPGGQRSALQPVREEAGDRKPSAGEGGGWVPEEESCGGHEGASGEENERDSAER